MTDTIWFPSWNLKSMKRRFCFHHMTFASAFRRSRPLGKINAGTWHVMTCTTDFSFVKPERKSEQLHNFLISSSQETHRGNITVVCDDGLVRAPWTVQHSERKATKPFCKWLDQKRWRLVCRYEGISMNGLRGDPLLAIGKLNSFDNGRGEISGEWNWYS